MIKGFTRREFLTGLLNHFQKKDILDQKTGLDNLSRQADQYLLDSNYPRATEYLKEILSRSPEHIQAQRKLGYCYLQIGDPDSAIQEFKSVLDRLQKDNFSLLYLGLSLCKKNQLDAAFYYWKQHFDVNRTQIQRILNLYIAHYEKGEKLSRYQVISELENTITRERAENLN